MSILLLEHLILTLKRIQGKWGTPTTLFMYGNSVIDSIPGYVDKDEFVKFVKENFKVEG